ncbi:unnamed protein product [Ectocarpus sp. 13 AM-2016]
MNRLRLPFPRLSPGPGHRWFNSHPIGGDPDLPDFRAWARTMLLRRLVHPRDADAWRAAEKGIHMWHAVTQLNGKKNCPRNFKIAID